MSGQHPSLSACPSVQVQRQSQGKRKQADTHFQPQQGNSNWIWNNQDKDKGYETMEDAGHQAKDSDSRKGGDKQGEPPVLTLWP